MKKIVIIGGGPGGLTSAMILAHRGFEVTVFEKAAEVGGRNAALHLGGYTFDTGPTFLMMRFILDEMFREIGEDIEDYLDFVRLEPMYRLVFDDLELFMTSEHEALLENVGRLFPGQEKGYDLFLQREEVRFEKLFPCLQKDYSSLSSNFNKYLLRSLPVLALGSSLFDILGRYYQPEKLRLAFTFQSKYLGMSPWECPGAFAIIPYIEHKYGIYHVQGGLNQISLAMRKAAEKHGARFYTGTPVQEIIVKNRTARGVILADGKIVEADEVIINADFAYAMSHLFAEGVLKKYARDQLQKKRYSCSTFMLYLGLNRILDLPHHNIFFAGDYRSNIDNIFTDKILSADNSFYLQNPSITDPTLAPAGKSAVYILVPVANNSSGIDWEQKKEAFRDLVLDTVERRAQIAGLRESIEAEAITTPRDWEDRYHVFQGATFNLSHHLTQMLYLRPRNRFEEIKNCYLVGGGTHPGSGLPTIYESGRISSNLISDKYRVPYTHPTPLGMK